MRKWIIILLVLSLALFALGCTGTTKTETKKDTGAAKDPYKIGAVVSATGPNSPLGEPERKTLLMEVDKINKAGGIDGHKIELLIEDDQSDPKNAVTAVSKLIDEKVVAIIGGTGTSTTMAMKPETTKAKVPQIALAGGIQITQAPNEWIFRTAQSDALAVQKVVDYMSKTLKIKRFAILHDSNAYGQSGATQLAKIAPKAELEIVATESYQTNDTNVTAQLTKIKGTKAQAVVIWGTNPVPAITAKNMQELGMTIPLIGSHGIPIKKFIEAAGSAAEKAVMPNGRMIDLSSAKGDQAKVINAYISDYKAKYNDVPNSYAGHAYDAINILAQALKESGADSKKLRDAIERTSGFAGISGIFNYSAENHDGLTASDLIIVVIKDGKPVEKK